jgi:transcriptional regulator GlxA family with amidase domain
MAFWVKLNSASLLDDTNLRIAKIALAAGFGSVPRE